MRERATASPVSSNELRGFRTARAETSQLARRLQMARMHLLSLAAVGLLFTGCVSQEKYNALKLDRDRYAEQLGQAQTEASAARSEAEAYKNQLALLSSNGNSRDGLVANLTKQNADLQAQFDDLNRRYADALNKQGAG